MPSTPWNWIIKKDQGTKWDDNIDGFIVQLPLPVQMMTKVWWQWSK
jgi:5,10-methylene-tetrahydrofolate dehydrogenase/methenyl tetrahydrofolate cyclohydrolase